MSSNPYGQGPGQSGSYEDYSQGYTGAPRPPYSQQSPTPYGQPQDPYGQPSTPGYSQPSASDYGQSSAASYGQASYAQPSSYGQSSTPQYAQTDYAATYPQSNYQQPTYGQSDPYGQPYTQQFVPSGYGQQYGQGLAPYSPTYDSTPRPSVTMGQAVRLWLKNWKNFSGRASRSEYWWVALAGFLVSIVLTVLFVILVAGAAAASSGSDAAVGGIVFLLWGVMALLGLAAFVPSLSLGVRRLHDANFSGWLYLLSFIPSVGGIILLVLMAQDSNPAGARFDDASQPVYGPQDL